LNHAMPRLSRLFIRLARSAGPVSGPPGPCKERDLPTDFADSTDGVLSVKSVKSVVKTLPLRLRDSARERLFCLVGLVFRDFTLWQALAS
jgi:hypothetical protein